MSDNKRMIYIKPENLEFYNGLENKSDFINGALETARLGGVEDLKTTEVAEGQVGSNRQGLEAVDAVEAMRKRDAERLKKYREQKGLYDPVNSPRE